MKQSKTPIQSLLLHYVYHKIMGKRITIVMDDDIDIKLRNIQGKLIAKDHKSYSYSRVVNVALRKQLKLSIK